MTPEGLAATVPQRSRDRLLPEELPHAGYLLARAADGRKVTDEKELERLHLADMSVRETRALMPAGRGNVYEDYRDSRGEATRRSEAGRSLGSDPEIASDSISLSIWAGAGCCGEHGDLATVAHAARLGTGEQIQRISGAGVDHGWAETTPADPKGQADKEERTIVMDAWADGPAVFASDSRFKSHQGGGTVKEFVGPEYSGLLQQVKERAAGIARQRDPREMPFVRPAAVWDATPGVDQAFVHRANKAMDKEVVSFREAAAKGYNKEYNKEYKEPKGLKTKVRDALASVNPFGKRRESDAPSAALRRARDKPAAATRWVRGQVNGKQGWVEQTPWFKPFARDKRQEALTDGEHRPVSRRAQPSRKEVAQAEDRAGRLPAALRNEIMAAAVAREVGEKISPKEAARKAPDVVAAARGLLDPTPRVADWVVAASPAGAAHRPEGASAGTEPPPAE